MKNATTTAPRFRPCAASAFERASVPTVCGCCGREELVRTVKMTDGETVMWMGVGCAAKAMGVPARERGRAAARIQDAAEAIERAERDAKHMAELAAWSAFLLRAAGPGERFEQIARLGGPAKAREMQRAEVAR